MSTRIHRYSNVFLRLALSLLLFLCCACICTAAGEMLSLTIEGARVEFHEGDVGPARDAARAVAYSAERLRTDLGIALSPMPSVALARGRGEFDTFCGQKMPDWSIAAALPEANRLVIDAGKVTPATASDANLTVFHEVVHLVLARLERGRKDRLPRWFHEGVATWLSGTRHLRGDQPVFDLAAAHGALIPLANLTDGFPARPSEAEMAYQESEAFIAHLVHLRGTPASRAFFDLYGEGTSFDDAFRSAFGMTVSGAETEWRESLSKHYNWLSTVLGALTFWGAMALLTLLVYLVVAQRARKQREEWEREETEWQVVPDEPDPDEEPDEDDEPRYEEEDDDRTWRTR